MDKKELTQELLKSFRQMGTHSVMLHQAVADILGLSVTEHKCLSLLHELGPMSAGRLAELTGLTTGAITGIVDRLEKAGYARRKDDPNDRRAVVIELKDISQFEKRIAMIRGPLAKATVEIISEYKIEDLKLILEFVKKLIAGTHEETIRISKLKGI